MTGSRAAAIWAGLFLVALIVGGLFEDGLPVRLIDSIVPLSERPVRLAGRVRDSWSATRTAPDQQCTRGTLTGIVTYVRDGDTIEVDGVPIRLNGVAAPEANEKGGDTATAAMRVMGGRSRTSVSAQRQGHL